LTIGTVKTMAGRVGLGVGLKVGRGEGALEGTKLGLFVGFKVEGNGVGTPGRYDGLKVGLNVVGTEVGVVTGFETVSLVEMSQFANPVALKAKAFVDKNEANKPLLVALASVWMRRVDICTIEVAEAPEKATE
jgi:hypothetical protein